MSTFKVERICITCKTAREQVIEAIGAQISFHKWASNRAIPMHAEYTKMCVYVHGILRRQGMNLYLYLDIYINIVT